MKTYKVTMHFNKPGARNGTPWTVHFRGICHIVSRIECRAPMVSEWKPEKKSNPRAFFTTSATHVHITKNNVAIIYNDNDRTQSLHNPR